MLFSRINSALYTPTFSKVNILAQRTYLRSARMLNEHRNFKTYFGATISGNIDDYIPSRIFSFGVWEPNLSRFMENRLLSSSCVVDIGAHIGYFTLLMSRLAREVIAIEASPYNYKELSSHVGGNKCDNVTIINKAVVAQRGEIELFESEFGGKNTGAFSLNGQGKNHSRVPCDTLLGILGNKSRDVSFIKIDIEGAERPVLEEIISNKSAFQQCLTIVAEVHNDNIDMVDSFMSAGFKCSVLENDYGLDAYLARKIKDPYPWDGERPENADLIFERI